MPQCNGKSSVYHDVRILRAFQSSWLNQTQYGPPCKCNSELIELCSITVYKGSLRGEYFVC
jgi:hypothetical protein